MEIKIKVNPYKFTKGIIWYYRTKQDLIQAMRPEFSIDCKFEYAYVYEKHRKVVSRTKIKSGKNKGKSKSEVIQPNHWIGYRYQFSKELLKLAGLKVEQGARTFKLVGV